jgi:hypothetical protein
VPHGYQIEDVQHLKQNADHQLESTGVDKHQAGTLSSSDTQNN